MREQISRHSAGRFTSRSYYLRILAIVTLAVFYSTTIFAQGASISGRVTDADTKEGLPGVTVLIPSLKIGAKSDSKGNFKINNVPTGKQSVEARLIGYTTSAKSADVEAGAEVSMDFALSAKALQQNEIVITGLSGEVDRKKLGNAIAEVGGAQISNSGTTSAIDALSGRVPGLVVSKPSGTPGAGTYMTLRGRKTILGSSEPLYVVDGIVIDNTSITDEHFQSGSVQLANRAVDISSENIENVQVLKGPSASALYGSLAANGVVLITTKRAKPGAGGDPGKLSTITFGTNVGFNSSSGRPGSEILQRKYRQSAGSNTSWGPALPADTTTYDHVGEVLGSTMSNEQSLSIVGGIPEFSYYISGVRSNDQGLIENSNYLKQDIRANLTLVPFNALSVKSNSNFLIIDNELPQDGSNRSGLMLGALRTPPEFNNTVIENPDGSQHRYASYDNPLWSIQNNKFNSGVARFLHSTEATLTPVDWLVLNGRVGLDKYNQVNKERLSDQSSASGFIGQILSRRYESSNVNLDLNATASFSLMEDLTNQLVVGSQVLWGSYASTQASSVQTLPFFDEIPAGSTKDATSDLVETKLVGYFGQLTTSYLDRYTLTLALRRDGSSTFGSSEQFHWYPKASFAVNLPLQDFDISPDILSSFKLRGGYGEAGSPSLPAAYATNFLYTVYGNNDGWSRRTSAGRNGLTGIRQGSGDDNSIFLAGNIDISPEISIEREIGFDAGFWNDRVNLELTFYHTNVNDMILDLTVPGSSGYDRILKNAASMWNEGIEAALSVLPIRTEDFSWNTSLTYSRNYNLVTSTGGINYAEIYGFTGNQNVAIVGRPLGVLYSVGWSRDANGEIIRTTGAADDPFGFDFKDAPQISEQLQVIGDPNPDYAIGWRNDFTIMKDFTVGFLFDGVFGQDVWNGTRGAMHHFGAAKETEDREEPWILEGKTVIDNATGNPVTREYYYRYYANSFAYGIDGAVVEDGSYIKLREVSLSYNTDILKDIHINNLKITLIGRNLMTITDYKGFDPEVNNFAQDEARGFDYFNLPPQKTIQLGVTLTY